MTHGIIAALIQMPWQWQDGGHRSMHWGWWVFLVALVVLLGWAAVMGVFRDAGAPPLHSESAEEALRRRFAEGEIGDEEFQRRHDKLRKPR